MLRRDAIHAFFRSAAAHLAGEWVLVGGAVVALLFDEERGTEDLDLVAVDPQPDSRFQLMHAALAAGMGAETVNSAADFFLWRS